MTPVRRHRLRLIAPVAILGVLLAGWFVAGREDGSDVTGSAGWSVSHAIPSPDGSVVAFLGSSPHDWGRDRLVIAGRNPREISPPGVQARSFAWMPDGTTLLLAFADDLGHENPTQFAILDLDGSVERRIDPDRRGVANGGIAIDPTGRHALMPVMDLSIFDSPTELWRLDLETGAVTVEPMTGTTGEMQSSLSFIDGDHLAFASALLVSATVGPNGWIGTLDRGTGATTRLTPAALTAGSPSVAPGGEYLVFDAFPGNERWRRSLWYVSTDGSSDPVLLIDQLPGRAAALEPDGRAVLVVDAGSPGDTSVIRRVDIPEDAPWLAN